MLAERDAYRLRLLGHVLGGSTISDFPREDASMFTGPTYLNGTRNASGSGTGSIVQRRLPIVLLGCNFFDLFYYQSAVRYVSLIFPRHQICASLFAH